MEVLLGLDAFEREHETDALELGKLKVSGKHDAQLEEKVKQQTQLAKQFEELKKKHGIKTKQDEKKEEQRKQLEEEDKKIKEMREEKSKKEKEEKNRQQEEKMQATNGRQEKEMQEKKTQEANVHQENATPKPNAQDEIPNVVQQTQTSTTQAIQPAEAQTTSQAQQETKQIQPTNAQTANSQASQEKIFGAQNNSSQQAKVINEQQSAPAPIVKVIMPEEKERDEIPPEGFVYKLVQGRRIELVRMQDEQQFNENEKKVNAANQELQKARIRGERTKARELEQAISDGIDVREAIVQKAKEAQK